MFQVGDLVTRKSYNNDIVFKVIDIQEDIFYLCGVSIRLFADSYKEDLVLCNDVDEYDKFMPSIDEYRDLNRNEYFYLPGRILHIDGDKEYLDKCMSFYKKNKIKAFGFFMKEEEMPNNVIDLLEKYNPDILVLTGHDGMIKTGTKYSDISNYRNSRYFVQGVIEARKICPSSNRLAIFAGACQSFFEAIMASGANFASSPARILIDFMDPLIVAEKIAVTDRYKFVTINDIVDDLRDGKRSVDGSGVMGKKHL